MNDDKIKLAAGYAVLLRKDGYTPDEVILLIQDTYGLNETDAKSAWNISLEKYAVEHKKTTRTTITNIGFSLGTAAIIMFVYGFFWIEIQPTVAAIFYILSGLTLLSLFIFIPMYLDFSFDKSLKIDVSKRNKVAQITPTLIALTFLSAALFFFRANEVDPTDGIWFKNARIDEYGERASTGGKSRRWYTILKLHGRSEGFRLFDEELKFKLVPVDSFALRKNEFVDIFVINRSLFDLSNTNHEIINIRQNKKLLTSLDHRNEMVRKSNKRVFIVAMIITFLTMIVAIIYGRYIFNKMK